jgi:predicted amidohydrolase YtcJ
VDGVFYGGRIYTLGREKKIAQAIAFENGNITAVGSDETVLRNASRASGKCNLKGKTVVPGFTDSHAHLMEMCMYLDLTNTLCRDEVLMRMKELADNVPEGEWVIGAGWKEWDWVDRRYITKEDLDACCPNHPAIAYRSWIHFASVNSAALAKLGIDANTPGAEIDSSGNLTGILRENAGHIAFRATRPNESQKLETLARATRMCHSVGITSVHDMLGNPEDFDVFRTADKKKKLGVRVSYYTYAATPDDLSWRTSPSTSMGSESDMVKLGGVKLFSDGAIGSRTAALSKPYADDANNNGMLIHTQEELDALVSEANGLGLQVAIHAIGDAGIGTALSAIANALKERPADDHRHRIEHLTMPSPSVLRKMERLGVIASIQPNFLSRDMYSMYLKSLGPSRIQHTHPIREVLKARIRLVFGSDAEGIAPLFGIRSTVFAQYETQRISVNDALESFTREPAFASFEEASKGNLEVGKCADFVVLSKDPLREPGSLYSTDVLKTVVAGRVVYENCPRWRF